LGRVDIEDMLDVLFLLIVLLSMVAVFRLARRRSAWRTERRVGGRRKTGESARIDTQRKLGELRDLGSLSQEEFETAETRVREE
jgi:hypothetical protein